jgi:hypothetical protein
VAADVALRIRGQQSLKSAKHLLIIGSNPAMVLGF